MRKTLLGVMLAVAAVCGGAGANAGKVQFQRRFLAGVWKNIKHINADITRFGSLGERVTAGARGDIKSTRDFALPAPEEIRNKIAILTKMLQRKDLQPADRDAAFYYIATGCLYLDDVKCAERYCRKLEKANRQSPLLAPLRREMALYKKAN